MNQSKNDQKEKSGRDLANENGAQNSKQKQKKKGPTQQQKISNHITQWSEDDNGFKEFLNKFLQENGAEKFPEKKLDAIELFKAQSSPDVDALSIAMEKQAKISTIKINNAAAEENDHQVTPTRKKRVPLPQKTPEEVEKDEERYQRKNGLPITNPTRRFNPIPIYCGGGKHCGYQVEYRVDDQNCDEFFPAHCDGADRRYNSPAPTKGRLRANHQSNWQDIICVHNRCRIEQKQLPLVLTYGYCCICRRGIHGGVISAYGLVLH